MKVLKLTLLIAILGWSVTVRAQPLTSAHPAAGDAHLAAGNTHPAASDPHPAKADVHPAASVETHPAFPGHSAENNSASATGLQPLGTNTVLATTVIIPVEDFSIPTFVAIPAETASESSTTQNGQ